MADELDRASEHEEILRQGALYLQSKRANKLEAEPTGSCLYCGEALTDGKRWCDAECRDEWEAERKRA